MKFHKSRHSPPRHRHHCRQGFRHRPYFQNAAITSEEATSAIAAAARAAVSTRALSVPRNHGARTAGAADRHAIDRNETRIAGAIQAPGIRQENAVSRPNSAPPKPPTPPVPPAPPLPPVPPSPPLLYW